MNPESREERRTRTYTVRGRQHTVVEDPEILAVKLETSPEHRDLLDEVVKELELGELAIDTDSRMANPFAEAGWVFVFPSQQVRESVASRESPEGTTFVGRVYRESEGEREGGEGRMLVGTDRLTVKFAPDLSAERIETLLDHHRLDVVERLQFAPHLFEVRVPAGGDAIDVANDLTPRDEVVYAEPSMVEHVDHRDALAEHEVGGERFAPTDPEYARQWQWRNVGDHGGVAGADVNAEEAWAMTTGEGIRVAVIDNGFDVTHPDLEPGLDEGTGFYRDDGFGGAEFVLSLEGYPDNRHGTFCAGMVSARGGNEHGGCGAAFGADLRLIACLSDQVGSQTTLARAIAYASDPSVEPIAAEAGLTAEDGVDVISCSLGPSQGANWPMYSVLQDAIDATVDPGQDRKGVPLFWAASNGNVTIDGVDGTDEVVAYAKTIAVGRSERDDTENGSAFGPELDFLAPGVNVYSTTSGGGYRISTGTSYATPVAAGVAALVLSVNPDLGPEGVRMLLRETCDKVGDVNYVGKRHDRYGYGRLNAGKAVIKAKHDSEGEPDAGLHPTISGPASIAASAEPPTFEVSLAGNYYYQVELTTRAELFDKSNRDERSPASFYPMWDDADPPENPPLKTAPQYQPPEAVWTRLLADEPEQVYYRMHSTSQHPDENWEPGYHNTTPDEEAVNAKSIGISYAGEGRELPTESVGAGGENRPDDVRAVKHLLIELGFDWVDDSGEVTDTLIDTIRLFQAIARGRSRVDPDGYVDGRVDVPGFTHSWLTATNAPRWQRMPVGDLHGDEGFYNVEVAEQESDQHDYGTDWMATVISDAGRHYQDQYRSDVATAAPLTVNDVSLPRGGDTPDHQGHETGLAADLRLPRQDGTAPGNTTFRSSEYDRDAMRAMLRAVRAQPGVSRILFNDPELIAEGLCQWATGHDNHAHVDVEPPERYEQDTDPLYDQAIEYLNGSLVEPTSYPMTLDGFQSYLDDTGVDYFSAKEMTQPNHPGVAERLGFAEFLPPQRWWPRGAALALLADRLRTAVGEPVFMRNWWRPQSYNDSGAVSGAEDSDHVIATAVDLDYRSAESRRTAESVLREYDEAEPWLELSLGLGNRTTHVGTLSPRGGRDWTYSSYRP